MSPWSGPATIDLKKEPSGIASAVFDAAPITVYDVRLAARERAPRETGGAQAVPGCR